MSRRSIENRDPQLCRRFVEIAKIIFSLHPEIEHRWSLDADEDHCVLEIVGVGSPGYDISIEVHPDEITLSAEGFHNHYMVIDPNEDFLQEFFGRVRDMLSPAMRIREQLSSGSPYRWHLENQTDGRWHSESTCGLLFWNWFGRRSECFYMNTNLPVREHHLDSSSARPRRQTNQGRTKRMQATARWLSVVSATTCARRRRIRDDRQRIR